MGEEQTSPERKREGHKEKKSEQEKKTANEPAGMSRNRLKVTKHPFASIRTIPNGGVKTGKKINKRT